MTDEKEPKNEDEARAASEAETAKPPAVAAVAESKAHASTPPSGPQISAAQAEHLSKKVEAAAEEVEVAQKATHIEHIDHVLTRANPLKPAHEVDLAAGDIVPASRDVSGDRVRLVYVAKGEHKPKGSAADMKPVRLLAQYDTTADVVHAAETLRDAGYSAFEAHSPFPIHGMDRAMGLKDSRLGWIVLACGLTGVSCAWLMMFWMNGVDYPLIIGGKPPGALPSMVPIMFEVTVLLSSFGAVFGMLGLNRLPQHHDPLFYSERFASFSNDKFFISVEAGDPKFNSERTRVLLERTKPVAIEAIDDVVEVDS